jgi:mono/diheme cytochrome c family protein
MEVGFPVSMFIRTAPRPLEAPAPVAPPEGDAKARGDWLLQATLCAECHTPTDKGEPLPGKAFAGGGAFTLPSGTLYTPNITSDAATGIGAYSDEDLLRALDEGVGKAGQRLYVMPWMWYRGMTDADKRALIAAVRRIPPVQHAVPASTFKR